MTEMLYKHKRFFFWKKNVLKAQLEIEMTAQSFNNKKNYNLMLFINEFYREKFLEVFQHWLDIGIT